MLETQTGRTSRMQPGWPSARPCEAGQLLSLSLSAFVFIFKFNKFIVDRAGPRHRQTMRPLGAPCPPGSPQSCVEFFLHFLHFFFGQSKTSYLFQRRSMYTEKTTTAVFLVLAFQSFMESLQRRKLEAQWTITNQSLINYKSIINTHFSLLCVLTQYQYAITVPFPKMWQLINIAYSISIIKYICRSRH